MFKQNTQDNGARAEINERTKNNVIGIISHQIALISTRLFHYWKPNIALKNKLVLNVNWKAGKLFAVVNQEFTVQATSVLTPHSLNFLFFQIPFQFYGFSRKTFLNLTFITCKLKCWTLC